MDNANKPGVLICATSNAKSQLDVFFFQESRRPKLKTVNFQDDILVSSDYLGQNIGVYERSGKIIKIYNPETTLKSSVDGKLDVNCLALYGDIYLFGGASHGKIHVFDLRRDKYIKSFNTHFEESIITIELTVDNRNIFIGYSDGTVCKFEIKTTKVDHLTWISDEISCMKSCPWDTSKLLLGFPDGTVSLYDINNKKKLYTSSTHSDKVNCVSYSYCNKSLAMSGGQDKKVVLYDTNKRKPIITLKTLSPVTCCSMSEGVLFAFGEANGDISVYDIRNLNKAIFSHKSGNRISFLQFSLETFLKNTKDTHSFNAFEASSCSVSNTSLKKWDYNCSVASCFSVIENSFDGKVNKTLNESFDISNYNIHTTEVIDESISRNKNRILEQVHSNIDDLFKSNMSLENVERGSSATDSESTVELNNRLEDLDEVYVLEIVRKALDEAILKMEDRLQNDILMHFIDELAIKEQNTNAAINSQIARTQELLKEHNFWWNKLIRSKRF